MVRSDKSADNDGVDQVRAIGRRLDLVRKRHSWSIRAMADVAGLAPSTLHHAIRNRRRPWDYYELRDLVEKLGEVWDTSWEILWRNAVDPPSSRISLDQIASAGLPLDTVHFTGRTEELARISATMRDTRSWVISGMAGVGKTALAIHALHRFSNRFSHGVVFLDLRGFTKDQSPLPGTATVDLALRAVGILGKRIPAEPSDRVTLLRHVLTSRTILLVLDNVAHESQVRPLLPGPGGSRALITSRHRLAGLDESVHLSLPTLSSDAAATLFQRVAGPAARQTDGDIAEIVNLCGHLPLALRIGAARLRSHLSMTSGQLLAQLGDETERLRVLDDGERSVAAALAVSYTHLDDDHRRILRLLGLHPGPDFERYATAALTGTTVHEARRALDALHAANLLDQPVPDRYRLHDLVRNYAAHQVRSEEPPTARRAALTRLLDYYRHTAASAIRACSPGHHWTPPHLPEPTTSVPALTAGEALAWLDTEHAGLVAAVRTAAAGSWIDHTCHLPLILSRYFHLRGHQDDWLATHDLALSAAHQLADPDLEARVLCGLGNALEMSGRHRAAIDRYQEALRLSPPAADRAHTHRLLGLAWFSRGHYDDSLSHWNQALALFQDIGDIRGEIATRNNISCNQDRLGDYPSAIAECRRALAIAHTADFPQEEADTRNNLGFCHLRLSHPASAERHLQAALALYRRAGDRLGEATTLNNLGIVYRQRRDITRAMDHHDQAVTLSERIGNINLASEILNDTADTCRAGQNPATALTYHRRAITVATQTADVYELARAHDGIASILLARGEDRNARRHWQLALATYTNSASPKQPPSTAN